MNIIESGTELRRALASSHGKDRIALVPTMGCLHDGHLSLIRKAKALADIVIVSIYVNPLQFGPNEDFDTYPRTFEKDTELCQQEGVDFIFHPRNLYPQDGVRVSLQVDKLDQCLCGASRPGHFDGVVTVVNILFNIVQPDIAVFGEKDWQQLAIIRRMTEDLHMPVEIIGAETVREDDGLAMSSRNRYLSQQERMQATALYRALHSMQKLAQTGENNIATLLDHAEAILAEASIHAEYLEVRDPYSLQSITTLEAQARVFIAARIGTTRLIDNIELFYPTEALS